MSSQFPRLICATLLLAMTLPASSLHGAGDVVDEATVRRWVMRLDATRKAERDEAKKELIRLGPAVLEWLPEPQVLASKSTAEAVKSIRATLERQKAELAVEASRLRIGGPQTVGEVLKRLSQDTGNDVVFGDLPMSLLAQRIELPQKPTFWDVIDELVRSKKVNWHFERTPSRLRLLPIDTDDPASVLSQAVLATSQSKAFRIGLRSVRNREVIGEANDQLARLEFDVAVEPRLRPLFVTAAASDFHVLGNREAIKTEWTPYSPDAKLELSFGQGRRRTSIPLDFRIPSNMAAASISVTGKLRVLTAAGEAAVEFPAGEAARGISRRRGGVTVTVRRWEVDASTADPALLVSALVVYDAAGIAFESHRTWMLSNVAGLTRADSMDGKAASRTDLILPNHGEVESHPNGSISVTYRFENPPADTNQLRFRYVAPTLLLDVPIDFEFRDVPLSKR